MIAARIRKFMVGYGVAGVCALLPMASGLVLAALNWATGRESWLGLFLLGFAAASAMFAWVYRAAEPEGAFARGQYAGYSLRVQELMAMQQLDGPLAGARQPSAVAAEMRDPNDRVTTDHYKLPNRAG